MLEADSVGEVPDPTPQAPASKIIKDREWKSRLTVEESYTRRRIHLF
jgi:hypothetical protein